MSKRYFVLLQAMSFLNTLRQAEVFFLYLYLLGGLIAISGDNFLIGPALFLFVTVFCAKSLFELSVPAVSGSTRFFAFETDKHVFHPEEKQIAFLGFSVLFMIVNGVCFGIPIPGSLGIVAFLWALGRITTNTRRKLINRAFVAALAAPLLYMLFQNDNFINCFLLALGIGSWWFSLSALDSFIISRAGFDSFFRSTRGRVIAYFFLTIALLSWLAFGRRQGAGLLFLGGMTLTAIFLLGLVTVTPDLPDKLNSTLFNFTNFVMSGAFFLLFLFDFLIYR